MGILLGLLFAVVGFLVVIIVCAVLLVLIQAILPTRAVEADPDDPDADRETAPDESGAASQRGASVS